MPGSAVIVVIYACAVTCGQSFTMLSVWDILISFWSVLMFSPTLLSLLLLLNILFTILLLNILITILYLLVITVIIISTELLALCDGYLGWDWVWRAGLVAWVAGRAGFWAALASWGFGVSSSSPQAPGHPTSMCDTGVKVTLSATFRIFLNFAKNCPL